MITVTFIPDDRMHLRLPVEVPTGVTIKEAATMAGVELPTFCMVPEMPPGDARPQYTLGNCGQCNVAVKLRNGRVTTLAACKYMLTQAEDGVEITVHGAKLDKDRATSASLIAMRHQGSCITCPFGTETCELRDMLARKDLGLGRWPAEHKTAEPINFLDEHPALTVVPDKCVLCRRCETICPVGAITFEGRGSDTTMLIDEERCINCGQCTHVCPAAAIVEKDQVEDVEAYLHLPNITVTVQVAPAVRVAIGEAFGVRSGSNVERKLYSALRRLGFDAVFDTNFSADLTIVEEGTEFIQRVQNLGTLPMITSCCPGWVRYAEVYWPDLLPHISTCKSPQQMLGALTKTYWAEQEGIDPKSIINVSIMPCTAKKYEAEREEMMDSGEWDVDYVLTTRELIRMLKAANIDLTSMPDGEPTPLLSEQTGAAPIFGATGGVMEAALRSVYALLTGEELPGITFEPVRGMAGVREAEVDINGRVIEVAVVHGIHNLPPILQAIREGRSNYAFIEIMTCPGGCVGGGGQPRGLNMAVRQERAKGLYAIDAGMAKRRSHENSEVAAVREHYDAHERHRLLHTHYTPGGAST